MRNIRDKREAVTKATFCSLTVPQFGPHYIPENCIQNLFTLDGLAWNSACYFGQVNIETLIELDKFRSALSWVHTMCFSADSSMVFTNLRPSHLGKRPVKAIERQKMKLLELTQLVCSTLVLITFITFYPFFLCESWVWMSETLPLTD